MRHIRHHTSRLVAKCARRAVALATATFIVAATASAQPPLRLRVVDPAWVASRAGNPGVVLLHVVHDGDYGAGHVPGARALDYQAIVRTQGTLRSELPDSEALRATFQGLGVSDSSTVVVYAHEAPMATRVLFTLAYLGIGDLAYMDGGLERWRREGHAVTREVPIVRPGHITVALRPELVADAEYVTARLGRAGTAFLDTRTTGEYVGTGNRSGMPSAGHLAGARQLEWEDLFTDRRAQLKPRAELEALYGARVANGDSVVTYCWVGYRASATWFVAQWLGYSARMYDGSYQDWSQRGLPTRAGEVP